MTSMRKNPILSPPHLLLLADMRQAGCRVSFGESVSAYLTPGCSEHRGGNADMTGESWEVGAGAGAGGV